MAQLNTYTDIQAFVNVVYEAAMTVARDNNLMSALVRNFAGQGMASRRVTIYGTATMNTVAETDDLVSQAFVPTTLTTLTPSEVAGQFFLTDQRVESDPFGVRDEAATELGMAMAQKIELDIISDFPNLTGGTVAMSGTAPTWAWFTAGLTRLRQNNAPGPYYAVISPYQWHSLGTAVTPATAAQTNAPQFQDRVMNQWWVGQAMGVNIFLSANMAVGTAVTAAMFSRDALALDVRRAPRLEPERDASRRGTELNLSAIYAHGVWRPQFGVQMISAGTAPTP